jgi:hypothetical protein
MLLWLALEVELAAAAQSEHPVDRLAHIHHPCCMQRLAGMRMVGENGADHYST